MTPGMSTPEKAAASMKDLERWSRKHGVPFRFPSRFPLSTLGALRVALLCDELALAPRAWVEAVFRAYWVDDRDISDEAVLAELLTALGKSAPEVLARAGAPEVKDALRAATEAARSRGVFGAPACIVGDELFFGKDRLDFVFDALSA